MNPKKPDTVPCRLCGREVAGNLLQLHQRAEARAIEEHTIQMIRDRHPEWTENDPTCTKCWEFYRDL